MKLKGLARGWTAVLCSIVLVGAGAVLVTPVANAVSGINWGHIWKTQIKPRADKRYYTKAQAKKKFAPYPKLIRGTYSLNGVATATSQELSDNISWGFTLKTLPTVHYIHVGDSLPTGCSGSAATPNASPGNLCIFEVQDVNINVSGYFSDQGFYSTSSLFGVSAYAQSAGAGNVFVYGTWALRTSGLASSRTTTTRGTPTGPRSGG